jgi:hypothetical protein
MTDFNPALAAKLGQQSARRPNGTAPRKAMANGTKPLQVPVEVTEQSRKPERAKVITTRGVSESGKRHVTMTPAPGFAIARVILYDIDPKTQRAKFKVVCRHQRGRPHQSGENA